MTKRAWFISAGVVAVLLGAYAYNEYQYYKKAPYLVLRQIESTYPKQSFAAKYAVESMGKTWQMELVSDGKGHVRQWELDPDARREQVALFDFPKKVIYWMRPANRVAIAHPLDGNGLGYADEYLFLYDGKKLGSRQIAGEPCHGWTRELAGQPMQSWFSDRNGCLVESSAFGKHTILTELNHDQPNPQEFAVPKDYKVSRAD